MRWRLLAVAVISIAVFGAQTAHASVIGMPGNNIGLVAYWSFNEGTSTIANDYSGNGNTGTLSTTGSTLPQWVPGKFGDALSFDGSTNTMAINNLSLGSTFSVSLWVNPSSYDPSGSGTLPIWVVGYGSPLDLGGETGGDLFYSVGQFFSTPFTALPLNTWSHVAYVVGGGNISLYINGVFEETDSYSPTSITDLALGADAHNNQFYFGGSLDDLRIYDRALSATEIAALYSQSGLAKINVSQSPGTLSQGLVGWWTMDGADTVWSSPTAGVEYDESGSDNTGTLENMTRSGSPTVGKIGQALNFDGSSSYVDMTGSSGVADNLSNFTVSAWFKTSTSVSGQAEIVSKFSTGGLTSGQGWALDDDGNSLIGIIQQEPPGNYAVKGSTASVDDGNWHQGVMVVTGGNTVTLYLDGQAQSPAANNGTVTTFTNASDIRIGNDYNSDFFPGSIDDVRVYDRALSASEIQQLYTLGAGTHINTSSANLQDGSSLSQGLVGLWTFDGPTISGTTVDDLSGNGNNGTNNGATPTIGKLGQALSFDGSSQYVALPNFNPSTVFNGSGPISDFTLSAWALGTYTSGFRPIIGDLSGSIFYLGGNDSGTPDEVAVHFGSDGYGFSTSPGYINDGTWHLWTVVIQGGTFQLYMDGQAVSGATGTVGTFSTTEISIGHTQRGEYWQGKIDDVRVYDRALSASEVQDLYLMGQ